MLRHLNGLAWRVSRGATITTLLMHIVVVFGSAGIAQSQRWVIDGLRSHPRDGGLTWLLIPVAVAAFAQAASTISTRVAANVAVGLAQKVEVELSEEILGHAAHVPTIEHLERSDYLDRVFLAAKGSGALASWTRAVTATAVCAAMLGLSLWLLALVHPALLLLGLTTLPLLLVAGRAQTAMRRVTDETAEVTRLESELNALVLDPAAAKEIRISGAGQTLSARADELWADVTGAHHKVLMKSAALEAAGWLCYALGLGGALALVARQVIDGRIGIGALVLVVSLSAQLRWQLGALRENYRQSAEAGRIAEHYRWLRSYAQNSDTRELTPAPAHLTSGITLENITFTYPNSDTPVLRTISTHLPAGSVVGLVGINGAGKSTLVKLLTGLYRPGSGRIVVDDQPLTDIDPHTWAAASCGVFQDFARLQLLVRETIGVGDLSALDDTAAIDHAVTAAGAADLVNSLSAGLDTQLGTLFGGVDLSGGQWQRLALARGMMRTAPLLLILDEPTAALDPQAEHDLFENFARHARAAAARTGAVTVLVSHRFSTVSMADHVIVIADGGIVESGSHQELLDSGGRYAELYATQARAYQS
ncbi:ABC transporter ATP-binding protein [Catenulispora yoronensis]|uniref:ABC transporter ATP-binding protein n=1 Tax=Catenulispora yoronensis TaxID=450799 RepID=A0ABP5H6Z6_9ACTN